MAFPKTPNKSKVLEYCEKINVIPIVFDKPKDGKPFRVTPSSFMSEMKMSTEERLQCMLRHTPKKSNVKTEIALQAFRSIPDMVIFQNFKPGVVHTIPLTLRNIHHISRPLKMICSKTPNFDVTYASGAVVTRIAPGMAMLFTVKFLPEKNIDYRHEITFLTEGETFVIPIIAIGPRPLLDLPNEITIPPSAVNVGSERILVVRNLGDISAVYNLRIDPPFSVTPAVGVLAPGETMQLVLAYKHNKESNREDELELTYETGEKLYIKVFGSSKNSNVGIEKGSVLLGDTFITLSSQVTLKIYNNSTHIMKFSWQQYATKEEQEHAKLRYQMLFSDICDTEKVRSTKLEHHAIIAPDAHQIVHERIFQDEIMDLENNPHFLFKHHNFSILPLTGEVWPNGDCEVTISFNPDVVAPYRTVAYCEMSGRTDRVPLRLNGTGIGCKLELNLHLLDAKLLFLCSKHSYEVVVRNLGSIGGEIQFIEEKTVFGGKIVCTPPALYLLPAECRPFVITFSSNRQGEFIEDVRFRLTDSKTILWFTLKGKIICPTVVFTASEIDFGNIAIGIPITKRIELCNYSEVPVEFAMRITQDGSEAPLTCEAFSHMATKIALPRVPQEIDVRPSEAVAAPNGCTPIEVTITPNRVGNYKTIVMIDMWETETETESLLVKWFSSVPVITCLNPNVTVRFCFMNYAYTRKLTIRNESKIRGYIYLVPQHVRVDTPMIVSPSITETFIEPESDIDVTLTIVTTQLGTFNYNAMILVFGNKGPQQLAEIVTTGQGPVISIDPEIMDFGVVKLLERQTKELVVTSDAPIPADFRVNVAKRNSPWTVQPNVGRINAEETKTFTVALFLTDLGKYQDRIVVSVTNGRSYTCELSAFGSGTSILIEPPVCPLYDFGPLFTFKKYSYTFTVTNMGTKIHRLFWVRTIVVNGPKKTSKPEELTDRSPFEILPERCGLSGGESCQMTIECYYEKVAQMEEIINLQASIASSARRDLIMVCKLMAKFEEPVVEFSTTHVNFRIDKAAENCFFHIQDSLTILNKTSIPLHIDITMDSPFFVLDALQGMLKQCHTDIIYDEMQYLHIYYQCIDRNNYRSYHVNGNMTFNYKDHRHVDIVHLHAEVNFPNIKLSPPLVDFGCVPNGEHSFREVLITNTSPLPVHFTWKWKESAFKVQYVEPISIAFPDFEAFTTPETSPSATDTQTALEKAEHNIREALVRMSEMNTIKQSEQSVLSVEEHHNLTAETSFQVSELDMELNLENPHRRLCYIKRVTFGLADSYFHTNSENERPALDFLSRTMHADYINDIFDVTPFYGILEPYETQVMTISFHPHTYICVESELQCHIREGPVDTLRILGMASNISFHLDFTTIDFGRQVFCEVCQRTISLSNTGYLGFDFVTSRPAAGELPPANYLLEAGWMCVEPRMGHIEPHSSVELLIRYFPGIAGRFCECFEIQIGHRNPLSVKVTGFGVFPQVYVSLPRPSLAGLPNPVCYGAVASISMQWLASVQNIQQNEHSYFKQFYDQDIPVHDRMQLRDANWEIISFNEHFPSAMDIELTIERFIAYRHIENHPEILIQHSMATKSRYIPSLYTPNYLINFGAVLISSIVNYSAMVFNYGPMPANVRLVPLSKKSGIRESGLTIQFKNVYDLPVGETTPLFVIFHPDPEVYFERITNIEYLFYLEVEHGARIPIQINATVTLPFLKLSPEILNFDRVKYGESKLQSIIITNCGMVTCKWAAKIVRCYKPTKPRRPGEPAPPPPYVPFHISNEVNGLLEVNTFYILHVQCEPIEECLIDYKVQISAEGNKREKFTVHLVGQSVEPHVIVAQDHLNFAPILPWTPNVTQRFIVTNPCNFPVEIYFPEFDSQIHQEEKIIKALTYIYETNKVYLPPRNLGEPLWSSLYEFYHNIVDELSMKILQEKWGDPNSAESRTGTRSLRRRSGSKTCSIASKSRMDSTTTMKNDFLGKSQEEIEDMIKEHLHEVVHENRPTIINKNPIKTAWYECKGPPIMPDPRIPREGVMFVFHGAPLTDYLYQANKTAREFGLDVINIDMMLAEVLATSQRPEVMEVRDLINTAYDEMRGEPEKQLRLIKEESIVSYGVDIQQVTAKDPIGDFMDKVRFINNPVEREEDDMARSDSRMSEPRSHPSKIKTTLGTGKKKDAGKRGDGDTFFGIPMETIYQLIHDRILQYRNGFVIDSLESIFIPKPVTLFSFLLRIVGNVRYIHVIILGNWFEMYRAYIELKLKMEEDRIAQLNQKRLREIDEMSGDQFDGLGEVDRELFRSHVLEPRKHHTQERLEALNERKTALAKSKISSHHKDVHHKNGKLDKRISVHETPTNTKKLSAETGTKPVKVEIPPEELELQEKFDFFNNQYIQIVSIAEKYDKKTGINVLGQEEMGFRQSVKKETSGLFRRKKSDGHGHRFSIDSAMNIQVDKTLGIPCWVIDSSKPKHPHPDLIVNMLHATDELAYAIQKLHQSFIEVPVPISELYLVGDAPEKRHIKKQESESFYLIDFEADEKLDNRASRESLRSKKASKETKKRADTASSVGSRKNVGPESIDIPRVRARAILAPGQCLEYIVRFSPTQLGEFVHKYIIEVQGWKRRTTVRCKGICEVPHIDTDPSVIFPVVRMVKGTEPETEGVFYAAQQTFDFGCAMVRRPTEKMLFARITEISLVNVSKVNAELSFFLVAEKDAFDYFPKSLTVKPGEVGMVKICAMPGTPSLIQDQFAIRIKNNPKIEAFKVMVQGSKCDFDIPEKILNFGKVLLYRKEKRFLTVKSKCMLPFLWRFSNIEEIMQYGFEFSATQGMVTAYQELKIGIQYTAYKVEKISDLPLQIEIYEARGRGGPFLSDAIQLNTEGYDVQIDVYYAKPDDTHLQFGDVKVQTLYKQNIGLYNRGNFNVEYRVELVYNKKLNRRRSLWGIQNPKGLLPPDILVPVTFACLPRLRIRIKEMPIFKIHLKDAESKIRIAQFPLLVSISSYYSQYEICPSTIDFGPLTLGNEKLLQITINNTGKFKFRYLIEKYGIVELAVPPTGDSKSTVVASKVKESKTAMSGGKKDKKAAPEIPIDFPEVNLNTGCFTIIDVLNEVLPGCTKTLSVICKPTEEGAIEEQISLCISECMRKYQRHGHVMTLRVHCCLPMIDFESFDEIFRELYVGNLLSDVFIPIETGAHAIFTKNDQTIHFKRNCMNKSSSIRIRIRNPGLVTATLNAHLELPTQPKSSTTPAPPPVDCATFAVDPLNLVIPPYTEESFTITFKPPIIEKFTAVLTITLVLPPEFPERILTLHVAGEGRVPQIAITNPVPFNMAGNFFLSFPPTLVGEEFRHKLTIANTGIIPTKVFVEILEDQTNSFVFIPQPDTVKLLKYWNPEEETRTLVMNIGNCQQADLDIVYGCRDRGKINCKVKLHVIDNPFENQTVAVDAEGYTDEISLKGLTPVSREVVKKGSRESVKVCKPSYNVDFGMGYVNILQSICFKIVNNTDVVYKFDFPVHPNVTFTPATGHLSGKMTKDVLASIISKVPLKLNKVVLQLKVCEIIYPPLGDDNPLLWDARMANVAWQGKGGAGAKDPSSAKTKGVNKAPEPGGIMVVPGSEKDIPLNILGQLDYSQYVCYETEISFADTMLFETKKYSFVVMNTGIIPLEVTWEMRMDEQYPCAVSTALDIHSQWDNGSCRRSIKSRESEHSASARNRPVSLTGDEIFQVNDSSDSPPALRFSTSFDSAALAFTISPQSATIAPAEIYTFEVTFAPKVVCKQRVYLDSVFANLSPTTKNLLIPINGCGLMPYCHFETEFSDYVTAGRRDPALPALIGDWKIIEFCILGIQKAVSRSFHIINPCGEDITYSWIRVTDVTMDNLDINQFYCHKPSGEIQVDRYDVAEFSFYPSSLGVFEEVFLFDIETFNWKTNFLFVANIREAIVYFLNSVLKLKPTIIGIDVTGIIEIKNEENEDLEYSFDENSLYTQGRLQKLFLNPVEDVIHAKSTKHIEVKFHPVKSGETIFDLRCKIRGLLEPLKLPVAVYCYTIEPAVACQREGMEKEYVQIETPYDLTFANLVLNRAETVVFWMKNNGKTKYYYVWTFDPVYIENKFEIHIIEDKGQVASGVQSSCLMKIIPLQRIALNDVRITLQIAFGPRYDFVLNLSAIQPSYKFSCYEHDFGRCFIRKEPIWLNRKIIEFKNTDTVPETIECLTEDKPYLRINCDIACVMPKEKVNIEVFFQPRDDIYCMEAVTFSINSFLQDIIFMGQGLHLLVDLVNSDDTIVDLGLVMVNKTMERKIHIRNSSLDTVTLLVDVYDKLPMVVNHQVPSPPHKAISQEQAANMLDKHSSASKSKLHSSKSSSKTKQKNQPPVKDLAQIEHEKIMEALAVTPNHPVRIPPVHDLVVMLKFSPTSCIKPFNQKIAVQLYGCVEPLCMVKAGTVGAHFSLDRYTLPFGIIMKDCTMEAYFLLQNKGDIGAKFSWEYKRQQPHFSLHPMEGYISPGMEVNHTASFCPKFTSPCLLRAELICKIEGYKNQIIILSGRCEELPPPKCTLEFQCPVRETMTRTVKQSNNSTADWQLVPVLHGEYYTCTESVLMGPGTTHEIEIKYKPMVMTKKKDHDGYILFKLPGGLAQLFLLNGKANHPKPLGEVFISVSCKVPHLELLLVRNWLPYAQSFTVLTEQCNIQEKQPLYKVTGRDIIEIQANTEKNYRWNIYAYTEGELYFKVIFINLATTEYIHFNVDVVVTPCLPLDKFTMSTRVRYSTSQTILLVNPTERKCTFNGTCTSPVVTFPHPFDIAASDKVELTITYLPILAATSVAKLELKNDTLGTYLYELVLEALSPVPEPLVSFETCLGKSDAFTCNITNLTQHKSDFTLTPSNPVVFRADKSVSLQPETSGTFDITFEPNAIGNQQANVVANSSIGGQFIYPIVANCILPRPQGPYKIVPGGNVPITFKNVFLEDVVFNIYTDPSPTFAVKPASETFKSKMEKKITITMQPLNQLDIIGDLSYPLTGKVTIVPNKPALSHIKWTYYLQCGG